MTDNPDYDNDPGSYPPLVPEPNPFDNLVAGLPDPQVTPEDEEQARLEAQAENFICTVEARPSGMADKLGDFTWAVKVTIKGGSYMYAVGGESDGPFRAMQRAIDKHAFGIELEQPVE